MLTMQETSASMHSKLYNFFFPTDNYERVSQLNNILSGSGDVLQTTVKLTKITGKNVNLKKETIKSPVAGRRLFSVVSYRLLHPLGHDTTPDHRIHT